MACHIHEDYFHYAWSLSRQKCDVCLSHLYNPNYYSFLYIIWDYSIFFIITVQEFIFVIRFLYDAIEIKLIWVVGVADKMANEYSYKTGAYIVY